MSKEKRERGRPSVYTRMTKEKMIAAYKRYRTVRAAARALGISHVTLLKVLKENGVPVMSNREAKRIAVHESPHTGSFAKWLSLHDGESLPRDLGRLQKLSGCTPDAISSYFYRRRKKIKDVLKGVPDLRGYSVELQDSFGDTYNTSEFERYEYMIDKFSLKVRIMAKRRGGETLIFDVPNVKAFARRVAIARQLQGSSSQPGKPASDPPSQDSQEPFVHSETEYFQASFQDSLRTDLHSESSQQERTSEPAESEPDEPDTQSPSLEE